jgi:hypothetical protein
MNYKKSAKRNNNKKSTISTIIILLLIIALIGLYIVLGDGVQTFISGLIDPDPITIDKVDSIELTNETLTLSRGDYEINLFAYQDPNYLEAEGKIIDFMAEDNVTLVRIYIKTVTNDPVLDTMLIGTVLLINISLDREDTLVLDGDFYLPDRISSEYEDKYIGWPRSARLNILADSDSVSIDVTGFSTQNAEYNGDWTVSGFEYTLNLLED